MTQHTPPRRRGSPKGPRYRSIDSPILDKVADAVVRNPKTKIKAAIRAAGVEGDANIRRIERHFSANKDRLMDDARKRAMPPRPVPCAEQTGLNQRIGFPYDLDLSKVVDPMAKYRKLFEQFQPTASQLAFNKVIADMNRPLSAVERIIRDMNRNRDAYHRMFGNLNKFDSFVNAYKAMGITDDVRRALLGTNWPGSFVVRR